ncbi:MAG: PBP1A family penicillin-binding protein [Marivibrio sp.]|uniref:transglycosylase domain-containing protein n=1 Tax=Marivibrio sp. TaxID=2039719 RepID=UPI0032EAC403
MSAKKSAGKKRPQKQGRQKKAAPPAPKGRWRLLRGLVAAAIWLMVAGAGVIAWFAWDLPDPAAVAARTERTPIVTVEAADGSPLLRRGQLYGEALTLAEISPHLPKALLATEDRRFYEHPGIDPIGVARALWTNIVAGRVRQGGSTITQQLAKNLFLTPERTLRRKVQEALLAFWLERTFTKRQILETYLNRVYLGAGAYGVDAAAKRYFGVEAKDLGLWRSAVLAGLPKAPSALNPFVAPERAAERAREVLQNMVDAGWLSADEAKAAARQTVETRATDAAGRNSRWFADWAMDRAGDLLGGIDQDVRVETTLEPALQRAAEAAAADVAAAAQADGASQMAFAALRPDGAVAAMLGGYDRRRSAFNRAVQARRQPGSTFKLFVYLAGFENGVAPDDVIDDREITVDGWTPRNASRGHRGPVTVREGAARSINTVAVAVAERAGRGAVIDTARKLGLTTDLQPTPSLALGVYEMSPLELTGAYVALSNGGRAVAPFAIRRIVAADGTVLYERPVTWPPQVLSGRAVAGALDVFGASMTWGTGKTAALPGREAVGKTGTSQDYRDAWFVGATAQLTAGVWMGADDAAPMQEVYGGLYPAQLWKGFMQRALADAPAKALPRPPAETRRAPEPDANPIERLIFSAREALSDAAAQGDAGGAADETPLWERSNR